MLQEKWQDRLNQSQAEYVPLIINSALAVTILAAIRDPIVIDVVPVSLILLNGIAISLLFLMTLWARWNKVAIGNGNQFVLIGLLIFAIKAIALVYIENEPYPFIFAILMFSLSLMFLSQRYLLGAALVIILAWTGIALISLSQIQLVSTLLALLIGSVMGLFVLERRIKSLVHMYELEQKVENLETMLPMCANCKQTRDEQGNWKSVEAYIEEKKGLQITHGVCPTCTQLLYGDLLNRASSKTKSPVN